MCLHVILTRSVILHRLEPYHSGANSDWFTWRYQTNIVVVVTYLANAWLQNPYVLFRVERVVMSLSTLQSSESINLTVRCRLLQLRIQVVQSNQLRLSIPLFKPSYSVRVLMKNAVRHPMIVTIVVHQYTKCCNEHIPGIVFASLGMQHRTFVKMPRAC